MMKTLICFASLLLSVSCFAQSSTASASANATTAGAGATATVDGNHKSGIVTLNTGTGTTGPGVLFTVTFTQVGPDTLPTPYGCPITPQSALTFVSGANVVTLRPNGNTGFNAYVGSSGVSPSVTLKYYYSCN